MAEAAAPATKAMAVLCPRPCWLEKKIAAPTATTKTVSHLYSAWRNAAAPSWICLEISCILESPASCFMIPPYLAMAKTSAAMAAPAAT